MAKTSTSTQDEKRGQVMSGPSCLMALMGHVSQGCQGICANVRGLVQSSNPHLFAPWTLAQYIYIYIFTVYDVH